MNAHQHNQRPCSRWGFSTTSIVRYARAMLVAFEFRARTFLKQTNSAAAGKSAMVVFLPCVARGSFQLRLDPSENTKSENDNDVYRDFPDKSGRDELSLLRVLHPTSNACRHRRGRGGRASAGAAVVHGQSAKSKVIDTHYHFYPPAYQKAWLG